MTTPAPQWHGWGVGDQTLSVAPSPDNARAVALILSANGEHHVLAEFYNDYAAQDCMDFLDGAFALTAQANAALVERVQQLGG